MEEKHLKKLEKMDGGGKGDDGVGITVNDGGIYYTKQGVPKIPSHLDKNSSFLGHPVMNK